MKTHLRKISLCLIGAMALLVLAACSNTSRDGQLSSSPESQPAASQAEDLPLESSGGEKSQAELTQEEAEALVRAVLPADFDEEYTLTLNDANRGWNGRSYYHFLLDTEQYTLETSFLVDKETRQVFSYYPDGAAYAPEDDPFFTSSESKDLPDWTSWSGSFVNADGVVLSLEKIDSTSFEFTLEGNGADLKNQIARILADTSTAQSTSLEKSEFFFQWEGATLRVTIEGEIPDGLEADSVSSPAQ